MKYDVFISYRRDKGAFIARNLQQALTMLGLKVFFDMEELTDGKFNEKLYDAIECSENVIFLMTEGALDRCVNEGDWVRNELEHVIDKNINLIPIAPTGTKIYFPSGLSEKLSSLETLEVSELNLEKLFNESVAKITNRLKNVTIVTKEERQEAEEAFLNQARRFKGNDGTIDGDEKKILSEVAADLGISKARRIVLIEKVEREYIESGTINLFQSNAPIASTTFSKFDVFISYRRDGGASDARLMYERLMKDGYSVSYDMDTLKNGNFNEELLNRIVSCDDFIVLLSKGCFDRTLKGQKRDDDWMRIEIATALYNKKNVIAVMLPGFEFPAKLPPDIDEIRFKNGPKYDLYYLDSFYDKLKSDFLLSNKENNDFSIEEFNKKLAIDSEEIPFDDSLDEIFGNDAPYWRNEAICFYSKISRAIPYETLQKIDQTWNEAERNLNTGDNKQATKHYIDTIELCANVKPSSIQFVTQLIADGIDVCKPNWFEETLKHAQKGDVAYQYGVGVLYAEGIGVAKNVSSAFRWYEKAASKNHIKALSAIGYAYAHGRGVEIDYKAAKEALLKAEKGGDLNAIEQIGFLYENGFGVRRSYPIAVMKYEKAANGGNSSAMVALARMLEEGIGTPVDFEKSAMWYRSAAMAKNPFGQRKLAEFLFLGKGVECNYKEALHFVMQSINNGDAEAIALLGRAYEEGLGLEKNIEKAEELYNKALNEGSELAKEALINLEAETQYRNGMKSFEGNGVAQDFEKAKSWFEKAANQGHGDAMEVLGLLYEKGLGCEFSALAAKKWYEKAAEKDNAAAMVGLGRLYFRGYDGIDKDYAKALEWFKKAAIIWRTADEANRWKVVSVFFYLGKIYTNGLGVEKNRLLGLRAYVVGANNGDFGCLNDLVLSYEEGDFTEKSLENAKRWRTRLINEINNINFADDAAALTVAWVYRKGKGIKKDLEESNIWLERAAKLGNIQALLELARSCLLGSGAKKDVQKAINYYTEAAKRGSNKAQYSLSWLYYAGKHLEQDYEKAFAFATQAASCGNSSAMETLYRMYLNGEGVTKNEKMALDWLQKSSELQNGIAMAKLGECYEFGRLGIEKDIHKAVELYTKSAENKAAIGLYNMGRCFLLGNTVEINKLKAFEYFSKAYEKIVVGVIEYKPKILQALVDLYYENDSFEKNVARFNKFDPEINANILFLFYIYFKKGTDLEKNIDKAVQCSKKLAELGDKRGQNIIGWMYYKGLCVKRNLRKAFEWTMKAAENGNFNAFETLFRMYRDGDGVEKNESEALNWLVRASNDENGDSAAALASMGECYEFGKLGVKIDLKKAYWFYYKGSQKNNSHSMYNRARCHLYGIGTEIDKDKAIEWLTKAANHDDDDLFFDERAIELLVKLYQSNDIIQQNESLAQMWKENLEKKQGIREKEIPGYREQKA